MSYSADDHAAFSRRVQKYMTRVQAIRDEGEKLCEIYGNEAVSGADPEFTDTAIASEQEHIDAVVYMLAFKDFVENGAVAQADRTQAITPFLHAE